MELFRPCRSAVVGFISEGMHVRRVAEAAQPRGALAQRQHPAEARLVADEQEARFGVAFGGEFQPVQHDLGRVVAPHGVDGQGEALRHVGRVPGACNKRAVRCGPRP
jgi:hypothetical protein